MTTVRNIPVELALPFWRYGAMFGPSGCAFLLDSALDTGPRPRFSFLGGQPCALLTGRRRAG